MRSLPLLGALVASFALPAGASAQLLVNLSEIDGPGGSRTLQEDVVRGVNAADCAAPGSTTLTFNLNSVGTRELQVWRGGAGSSCELATARSGDMVECDELPAQTPDDDGTFSMTLAELLTGTTPSASLCDAGGQPQGDAMRIFVFNRDGALGSNEDIGASEFARLEVIIDASPPSAPEVSPTSASGATSVRLAWTGIGETNISYQVYFDPDTLGCAGSGLTPGQVPPASFSPLFTTGVMAASASVDPTNQLGLEVDEERLVYVAALDNARNVGELSEGVCVRRVPTLGYCDTLAQMAEAGMDVETCPDGCAAGAAGPGAASSLLFAGLALLSSRRRRGLR